MKESFTSPLLGRVHFALTGLVITSFFFSVCELSAADLYWDADGAASGATGGTGDWSKVSAWRAGSSIGTLGDWVQTTSNAYLGGNAGTITLGAIGSVNITATSVIVSSTGYKITTSTVDRTLKVSGNIALDANVALTLEKSGTGGARFEASEVSGGAGSSLILSSGVATGNSFELGLTGSSSGLAVPVTISGSSAGSIGVYSAGSSGQKVTISGGFSNSSSASTLLTAKDNTTLTLQTAGISGSSGTVFGTGGNGAGTINLNVASSYAGSTTLNTAATGNVKLGLSDALPTTTALTVKQGILNLGTYTQTVGSLAGDAAGVIKGASGSKITVNQTTSTAYAGMITDSAALEKSGAGVLTLSGANIYTGNTTVSGGTLEVTGSTSATSAVSVGTGATLQGTGTIGGNTSVGLHGSLSGGVGAKGIGELKFSNDLTLNSGSIFSWDINVTTPTSEISATIFDTVLGAGATSSLTGTGAVFKVVLADGQSYADPFWAISQSWTNIFGNFTETSFSLPSIFSSATSTAGVARGSFAFTGNTLQWTAVPEPTSALAGAVLIAGLMRRKR